MTNSPGGGFNWDTYSGGTRPLRDHLPTFRADRGSISFDPDHPSNVAARVKRDAVRRAAEARWLPLHAAVRERAEGLVLRLVDMHYPNIDRMDIVDQQPWCAYCTSEDGSGVADPLWPCPELRLIAAELGVELPADPEDEEDADA